MLRQLKIATYHKSKKEQTFKYLPLSSYGVVTLARIFPFVSLRRERGWLTYGGRRTTLGLAGREQQLSNGPLIVELNLLSQRGHRMAPSHSNPVQYSRLPPSPFRFGCLVTFPAPINTVLVWPLASGMWSCLQFPPLRWLTFLWDTYIALQFHHQHQHLV